MNFLAWMLAFFLGAQGPTLGMIGQHASASAPPITRVEILKSNGSCSGGLQINYGTSTTAGELTGGAYLAGVTAGNAATITDSAGDTYVKDGEITNLGSHGIFGLQHFPNAPSGVTWLKLTVASETECAFIVFHYKNLATSPVDQNTGNPTSSGGQTAPYTFASGAKTTTSANELLLGAVGCYGTGGSTGCSIVGTQTTVAWPTTPAAQQIINGGLGSVALQELIVSSTQTGAENTGTASGPTTVFLAPMLTTFHQ